MVVERSEGLACKNFEINDSSASAECASVLPFPNRSDEKQVILSFFVVYETYADILLNKVRM